MTVEIFDDRICQLGEGPLWHPTRKQFFWFDILGKRLMTQINGEPHHWQFDEHVSAAGWVDDDTLLIASETSLFKFNLETAESEFVVPLEVDNPATRSNDGRADPWGGFWIGTMGLEGEADAGAIYRYYQGEIRKIITPITISNSICFAPDQDVAYFADTKDKQIMKQELDADDGWPVGEPTVFVDLTAEGFSPDGSVVDAEGCLWNAQWGAGRVARYSPDATFMSAVYFPAKQTTCPSFGGVDLTTMFMTSAAVGLDGPDDGKTFSIQLPVAGQAEPRVIL